MIGGREIAQNAGAEYAAPPKCSTVACAIAAKIAKIAAAFELQDAQGRFWRGWHSSNLIAPGERLLHRRQLMRLKRLTFPDKVYKVSQDSHRVECTNMRTNSRIVGFLSLLLVGFAVTHGKKWSALEKDY